MGAANSNLGAANSNSGMFAPGQFAPGQSAYQVYATPQIKPIKTTLLRDIVCMAGKALHFLDDPAAQSWSATVLGAAGQDTMASPDYSLGGYIERVRVAKDKSAGASFEEISALIGLTVKAELCGRQQ